MKKNDECSPPFKLPTRLKTPIKGSNLKHTECKNQKLSVEVLNNFTLHYFTKRKFFSAPFSIPSRRQRCGRNTESWNDDFQAGIILKAARRERVAEIFWWNTVCNYDYKDFFVILGLISITIFDDLFWWKHRSQ